MDMEDIYLNTSHMQTDLNIHRRLCDAEILRSLCWIPTQQIQLGAWQP